jgi:very-short-patch-repair endonuclease
LKREGAPGVSHRKAYVNNPSMNNSNQQNNYIKQTARRLRRNQTASEVVFWQNVCNRKRNGMKFLRQHPIVFEYRGEKRFFITDFYCHEAGLIVEIDGGIHELQEEYDKVREHVLNCLNLRVVRFKNEEVQRNLSEMLEKVKKHLVNGSLN